MILVNATEYQLFLMAFDFKSYVFQEKIYMLHKYN